VQDLADAVSKLFRRKNILGEPFFGFLLCIIFPMANEFIKCKLRTDKKICHFLVSSFVHWSFLGPETYGSEFQAIQNKLGPFSAQLAGNFFSKYSYSLEAISSNLNQFFCKYNLIAGKMPFGSFGPNFKRKPFFLVN